MMNSIELDPLRPVVPVRDQDIVKGKSFPTVVGIFSVTTLGALASRAGNGDGQLPLVGQSAGTGPIVVDVAEIAPSSTTLLEAGASWITSPGVAWVVPLHVSWNVTGQVTTCPGVA
jgi:hypothetical protein